MPETRTASASLAEGLKKIRSRHGLPGLAAAVVEGRYLTAIAVVGARVVGEPDAIALHDRFHIASCTKSITAMLAAVLVQEGRLDWSSRLVDVVPDLRRVVRPEYQDATLEQLLAHAARFPAYTQFGPKRLEELKALPGSPTEQRLRFLVDVLSSEQANTGTGDAAYSNLGYTAAAAMMERATRTAWEDLVLAKIFTPLALHDVTFGWPATAQAPDQPRGHLMIDGRLTPQPLDDSYMLPVALWPAGAVSSSIGDLATYAADHLNGLRGRPALLPQGAYQRLHRTLDGAADGFSLGWGVRSDPKLGVVHFGAGSGGTFFVRITVVPDRDLAGVVAANSGEAGPATREVIDAVLAGSIELHEKAGRSHAKPR